MRENNDTIVAISTPPGEGGIGIVRISGVYAINVAQLMFKPKRNIQVGELPARAVTYGFVYDNISQEKIDEALLTIMKAPNSYTREDIVEISCHAGIVTVRKVLELALKNGARLAEPGEFTKRAFLNGRLDLAQAEAVMDIISAKTNEALTSAVNQLAGGLSAEVMQIREQLLGILARIEVSIDFPEHDTEEVTSELICSELNEIMTIIRDVVETAETGRIIREGLKTAIVGKPNVGKSSLLNAIIKQNKAIVTDVPGTTRDIIEEYINIRGVLLNIIDTAGFRETEDIVEKLGVEKTREVLGKAELILYVIDASVPLSKEDTLIMDNIKEKQIIVLLNKTDLNQVVEVDEVRSLMPYSAIIKTSVKEDIGLDKLEEAIIELVYSGSIKPDSIPLVTNIRHKEALQRAVNSISKATDTIINSIPVDIVSIDIKDALEYLGEITGESISEDIIDRIFKDFCLGK